MVVGFTPVTEHHHFIGYDLYTGVLAAFFIVPAAGLQTSFYIHLLTFDEVLFVCPMPRC